MNIWILAFLGLSLASQVVQAGVSKETMATLTKVVGRYQKSAMVESNVEKKVVSEILGREKIYQGKVFLAPQRFRLETQSPDHSLIVFDGTTLWNIQYPPEDTKAAIQVAKAKLDKKNQNQVLLGDLLVSQGQLAKFDFVNAVQVGDQLELSAKAKSKQLQVSDLKFRLSTSDKVIRQIEYSDELGNKTIMTFSETKFLKKKDSKKFQYKPEKGAQVTEL